MMCTPLSGRRGRGLTLLSASEASLSASEAYSVLAGVTVTVTFKLTVPSLQCLLSLTPGPAVRLPGQTRSQHGISSI